MPPYAEHAQPPEREVKDMARDLSKMKQLAQKQEFYCGILIEAKYKRGKTAIACILAKMLSERRNGDSYAFTAIEAGERDVSAHVSYFGDDHMFVLHADHLGHLHEYSIIASENTDALVIDGLSAFHFWAQQGAIKSRVAKQIAEKRAGYEDKSGNIKESRYGGLKIKQRELIEEQLQEEGPLVSADTMEIADWGKVKKTTKMFADFIMRLPCDVICTARLDEKTEEVKEGGETKLKVVDFKADTHKEMPYEFSLILRVWTRADLLMHRGSVPEDEDHNQQIVEVVGFRAPIGLEPPPRYISGTFKVGDKYYCSEDDLRPLLAYANSGRGTVSDVSTDSANASFTQRQSMENKGVQRFIARVLRVQKESRVSDEKLKEIIKSVTGNESKKSIQSNEDTREIVNLLRENAPEYLKLIPSDTEMRNNPSQAPEMICSFIFALCEDGSFKEKLSEYGGFEDEVIELLDDGNVEEGDFYGAMRYLANVLADDKSVKPAFFNGYKYALSLVSDE